MSFLRINQTIKLGRDFYLLPLLPFALSGNTGTDPDDKARILLNYNLEERRKRKWRKSKQRECQRLLKHMVKFCQEGKRA